MTVWQLILGEFVIAVGLIGSLNFIVGKMRIWSIGHIGFFAIGEIAVGYAAKNQGSLVAFLVFGLLISFGIATVLGLVTFRLSDDFFVILSVGFVALVYGGSYSLLGPQGISGIERLGSDQLDSAWYLALTLVPATLGILLVARGFSRSPLERVAGLMRASNEAASIFGVPVRRVKLGVFTVGSVSATLLGGLAATYFGSTEPEMATLYRGILIFAMMLLGGIDRISGTVLGALVLTMTPRVLEAVLQGPFVSYFSAQLSLVIFGCLMLLTLRFLPSGILGRRNWRD